MELILENWNKYLRENSVVALSEENIERVKLHEVGEQTINVQDIGAALTNQDQQQQFEEIVKRLSALEENIAKLMAAIEQKTAPPPPGVPEIEVPS
jgi:hypothetical protein